MLRLTLACLLLLGSACSKAKKAECPAGTDPRTGACVAAEDPNAARLAALQAQVKADSEKIQAIIARNKDMEQQLRAAQAQLKDPNLNETQTQKVLRQLSDLGITFTVMAGQSVAEAALRALDDGLGNTPTTQPTASGDAQ